MIMKFIEPNGNTVYYDCTEFRVRTDENGVDFLHYVGFSKTPLKYIRV